MFGRSKKSQDVDGGYVRSPFSFGLWLRLHGVDLITMALMGAVGLGIYEARECSNRFSINRALTLQ